VSTTPFAGPYPTTIAHILVHHITTTPATSRRAKPGSHVLRRRPTRQQGLALEKLGHAIEYLVDSQLYLNPGATPQADVEATQILMRLSREVFAECREAAPATPSILRLLHLFAPSHPA
jgi:hypothetical protein